MRIGIAALALLVSAAFAAEVMADARETSRGLDSPKPSGPVSAPVALPDAPSQAGRGVVDVEDATLYPSATRAKEIRYLRSSLAYLSYQESNSVVDGVLHTVMGGVWIGFGAGLNGLDPAIKAFYFVQGSSMLARATLSFAIRPNAKRASLEMDTMGSSTRAEADARIAYGAGALKKLAKQHRVKRLLGSSLSIASGILPLPFVLNSSVDSFAGGWNIIVFVGAGIDVITGIVGLAIRTEAEKRHRAYEAFRTRREPRIDEVSVGFMPVLGGGGLSVRLFY